jgi:hypothetical protein
MGGAGDENEEISAFQSGPVQRRRAKPVSWTAAKRKAFLTELAHSCNVTRAHKAAEMCNGSAYSVRQRDAEFARQWQAALEIGYERLEMALARRALEVLGELELDEREEPVEKMTVAQAIEVMNLHRRSVQQGRGHQRRLCRVATQEETDAVLLKRIAMVERQRERREGAAAEDASAGKDGGA